MSLAKNDKFEIGLKFFNTLQSRLCFYNNGLVFMESGKMPIDIGSLIIVVIGRIRMS